MIFLADEDFNNRIVRGLLRRLPYLDLIRVQNTPLFGAPDDKVLEWATENRRVLLTHDISAIAVWANERFQRGERVAGIIVVPQAAPIGLIIEDILSVATVGTPEEFENRIVYLPL